MNRHAFLRLGALTVASAALLAGCGGGGSGDAPIDEAERIDSAGRLAVLQADSANVRIWDLDENKLAQSFPLDQPPAAVYASPGGRYAIALQRTQDQAQFIDGGLWQEDHGDHLHDYRQAPRLLSLRLPAVRPTHFETHGSQAALFNDGLVADNKNAEVVLLSDAGIGKGTADARLPLPLPLPMHGTAEPLGEHLLTTYRDPASTSTLPVQVDLYRRTTTGFTFVQRFAETCPDLHGSFTNAKHTAFGCSDGVLVVSRSGTGASATFTARKLPNPADMPTGVRIGTIKGHDKVAQLVGLASPGHLFVIDADAGRITRLNWAEGRTVRAQGFDRAGNNYAVLDDQGALHIAAPANAFATRAKVNVVAQMPTAAPFPSLVSSLTRDELFVSDPAARQVAVVDLPSATVRKRMDMGFAPTGLAWLGIAP